MKKKLFLFAACVSTLALNAMEWQSVFKEDFGGNSLNAPAYGQTVPDGLQTNNYRLYKGVTLPSNSSIEGYATLLKAAEKTYIDGKLWSETSLFYGGNQPMTKGSDHTMAGNTDKGYFLFAEGSATIYKKTVSIPSGNEKFRVSAWVACAIQWANSGCIKLEVKSPSGKLLGSKSLYLEQTKSTLNWEELVVDVNDPTRNYNSVTVSISPDYASSCYYYAIDDISVSVWRPTLNMTSVVRKNGAYLEFEYNFSEIKNFFGNKFNSVYYEWRKKSINSDKWETLAGGKFTSSNDIFYRWPTYYASRDNGFYKLVIYGDGKSIEQVVEMNYSQDEIDALGRKGEIVTTFRSLDVEDEDSEATADVTVYSDQNQLFVSKEAQEYTIYDMSGRVVAQSNQLPVNISVLKAGVYVVDVDGSRVKFIKK